jgi:hypothetical protein
MKRLAVGLALVALVLAAVGVHAQGGGGLPLPQISVTPASYDFGNVPIGAVASGALLVKNIGGGTLIVDAVKTKAPFLDGVSSSFTLGPGRSRRVNIGFAPTAPVQYNSVCTFQSNAANTPVLNVPLTGWGVE